MKTFKYEFEADDEFEKGDCFDCPLSYEEDFYDEVDGYDYVTLCVLRRKSETCPLEEVIK